jgi:oligoribonuclease NrnB/cAMP/cGMP phosphodiesterase (DHH superfamily)
MKKILIISHRDLDGITSAVSYIWNYLETINVSKNIKNISKYSDIIDYNHGEDILKKLKLKKIDLKNYSHLIITDLSFSFEIMNFFYKKFKENLIWIDHHKRITDELEKEFSKQKIKITGIRDFKHAACFLVWKFFKKDAPDFVKYVQDMDLWTFKLENSKEFIAGIDTFKGPFTKKNINFILKFIDVDYFNKQKQKIIERGKIIQEHQIKHVKEQLFSGKIIDFFGNKAFVVNSIFIPGVFAEVIFKEKKYKSAEILIIWYKDHNTNKFKFSLRRRENSKVDLSLIAKKLGGGGHPAASGFTLNSLAEFKYE